MSINQVNWFEIPVTDMDRAKKFYEGVFNQTLTEMPMGPMQMAMFSWTPGGTNASGALVKGEGYTPNPNGTKIYFQCENVNYELQRIEQYGGQIFMPKTSLGEFGNMALVGDTEGNVIGLHSNK